MHLPRLQPNATSARGQPGPSALSCSVQPARSRGRRASRRVRSPHTPLQPRSLPPAPTPMPGALTEPANCACTLQLAAPKLKIQFLKKSSYLITRCIFFSFFQATKRASKEGSPAARLRAQPPLPGEAAPRAPRRAGVEPPGRGRTAEGPAGQRFPLPPLSRGLLLAAPPGSLQVQFIGERLRNNNLIAENPRELLLLDWTGMHEAMLPSPSCRFIPPAQQKFLLLSPCLPGV